MCRCGRGLEEAKQELAKKLGPIPSKQFKALYQRRGLGDYRADRRGGKERQKEEVTRTDWAPSGPRIVLGTLHITSVTAQNNQTDNSLHVKWRRKWTKGKQAAPLSQICHSNNRELFMVSCMFHTFTYTSPIVLYLRPSTALKKPYQPHPNSRLGQVSSSGLLSPIFTLSQCWSPCIVPVYLPS